MTSVREAERVGRPDGLPGRDLMFDVDGCQKVTSDYDPIIHWVITGGNHLFLRLQRHGSSPGSRLLPRYPAVDGPVAFTPEKWNQNGRNVRPSLDQDGPKPRQ